jgi:drug/metabolite transporter (DMT)-like permease
VYARIRVRAVGGTGVAERATTSDTLAGVDRTRAAGITLVVISAIAFGSGGLFAKPVYAAGVDWLTLMSWRFAIGGGMAWVVLAFNPSARRALRRLPRRTLLGAVGLGVFYVTNTATYYAGLQTVPLGLAALIVYLYPPIVAVLALRLGRPLEGRRAWGALGIAVLGVVLALGGIPAGADIPREGLLLILASPVFYSIWIILAARVSGERSDRVGTDADDGAAVSAIGAIMLSSTAVVYWIVALAIGHPVLPATIPSEAWPGIIGVAIVAGFIPVQAFYAGAQRIGAAQASLVSTVEPLWTIVAAGAIYGERLEPVQLLGGAFILGGVLLSQTGRPKGAEASTGDGADSTPVLPQPVVRLSED